MKEHVAPPQEEKKEDLEFLGDVPLQVRLLMGQVDLTIGRILGLRKGSIIELDKQSNEPFELHANGSHVANGEVVVVNENLGVRITQVVDNDL